MNGGFFILILVLLLVMWLFMVRPQRRRQQAQQAMIDNLRIGDEILTAGGFYGTVAGVREDEVTVELSPGTEVRVAKRAIAAVIPPDEQRAEVQELEAGDVEVEDAAEPDRQARR